MVRRPASQTIHAQDSVLRISIVEKIICANKVKVSNNTIFLSR